MLILTNENKTLDLNLIGKKVDDIRYSVYDYSNKEDPDYLFKPLVFLDTFNCSAIELSVGKYRLRIPSEWSILLAEPETGEIEIIPIEDLNNRNFQTFVFNPITGYCPKYLPVKLEDIFLDIRWVFPKLDHHNFLTVPLSTEPNPDCIFIINEKDQRKIKPMTLEDLF